MKQIQNLISIYIREVLFVLVLLTLTTVGGLVVYATTLISDDFTGTTIDTDKWSETDAGGVGGSTGNVQQDDILSLVGTTTWGGNMVQTKDTYTSTDGTIVASVDFTVTNCTSSASGIALVFGGPNTSSAVFAYYYNRKINFRSFNSSISGTTSWVCTDGVPFNIKMELPQAGGANLYIDDVLESTLDGTVITSGKFSIQGFGAAMSYADNFSVTDEVVSASVPGVPASFTVSTADEQVLLEWVAPASNGADITDYKIEYQEDGAGSWTTFSDGISTDLAVTVTGLTNNTAYNFRVSAINSVGTGDPTSASSGTPNPSAPAVPQSLTTSASSTKIILSWLAPATDGGSVITDYKIEYQEDGAGSWTTFVDATSTATTTTITGLTNGVEYNFRVSAINAVGTGSSTSAVSGTPALGNVDVAAIMTDSFTGTTIDTDKWSETDAGGVGGSTGNVQQDGILTLDGTEVWGANILQTVDTFDSSTGTLVASVDFTVTNCGTGAGVALTYGGTTISDSTVFAYYYQGKINFKSFNPSEVATTDWVCTVDEPFNLKIELPQDGGANLYIDDVLEGQLSEDVVTSGKFSLQGFATIESYADNFSVGILGVPDVPASVAGVAGDGQVALSWDEAGGNGADVTDYVIEYRAGSSGSWTTFSDGTSTATTTTVTGLQNGVLYQLRVSAVSSLGTSGVSSAITVMPVTSTPATPTIGSIATSGYLSVAEELTGTYTFVDTNGDSEDTSLYRWLRSDTEDGTFVAISGATSEEYTLVEADEGAYLKFEVTPVSDATPTTGTASTSSVVGPIQGESSYINVIISTGQSLAIGRVSSPALSTTQPYSNLMLSGAGVGATNDTGGGGRGTGTDLISLIEIGQESIGSSMANGITNLTGNDDYQIMVLNNALGGTAYSGLKKGSSRYTLGVDQLDNAISAADAAGKRIRVLGVTSIHGETDNKNGITYAQYKGYLEEWQSDYETDVNATTGRTGSLPFFTDQMSTFSTPYGGKTTGHIPMAELDAALENPNDIYLVAPKYFLNYSDQHHLTSASSRWLGEYYAKVMHQVIIEEEDWKPLYPEQAFLTNDNEILVNFYVPAGELVFDTTMEPVKTNYGFEYYDDTSSVDISAVEILDADTVKITLDGTPTGDNMRVRYAYTGVSGAYGGTSGAPRGNLRDTDDAPSEYGNTLYNWAVHFDKAIVEDETAPTVSSIATTTASTTVSVTWTTDEAASSIVDYGLTSSYGASTPEADVSARVTSHTVSITGLVPCTKYHYRLRSVDAALNEQTSSDYVFRTKGCAGGENVTVTEETTSAITKTSGGTVDLLDSGKGISLSIPSSFSTSDAQFQIKRLNKTTTIASIGLPAGRSSAGEHVYDFKALDSATTSITTFDNNLSMTLSYSDSDVAGLDESSLVIYTWDGSAWSALTDCVVDTDSNTVTCSTNHFSIFALLGSEPEAESSSSSSSGGVRYNLGCKDVNATNYDYFTRHLQSLCEYTQEEEEEKQVIQISQTQTSTPLVAQNLQFGDVNEHVRSLQQLLNASGFTVAQSGPGSVGHETTIFGYATRAALIRYQKANNITPAVGYFGPITRASID